MQSIEPISCRGLSSKLRIALALLLLRLRASSNALRDLPLATFVCKIRERVLPAELGTLPQPLLDTLDCADDSASEEAPENGAIQTVIAQLLECVQGLSTEQSAMSALIKVVATKVDDLSERQKQQQQQQQQQQQKNQEQQQSNRQRDEFALSYSPITNYEVLHNETTCPTNLPDNDTTNILIRDRNTKNTLKQMKDVQRPPRRSPPKLVTIETPPRPPQPSQPPLANLFDSSSSHISHHCDINFGVNCDQTEHLNKTNNQLILVNQEALISSYLFMHPSSSATEHSCSATNMFDGGQVYFKASTPQIQPTSSIVHSERTSSRKRRSSTSFSCDSTSSRTAIEASLQRVPSPPSDFGALKRPRLVQVTKHTPTNVRSSTPIRPVREQPQRISRTPRSYPFAEKGNKDKCKRPT